MWPDVHVRWHLTSFQLPSSGVEPMTHKSSPGIVSKKILKETAYFWPGLDATTPS